MSEILNNVMKFINENTYLLIGICVFLILVLIGYLIDNSVKSKKVRKDVKNETMAKEAQSNSAVNNISIDKKEDIMTKPFEEKTESLIIDNNINKVTQPVETETLKEENTISNEVKDEITEPINFNFDLDSIKTKSENIEPKTEESTPLNNSFVNDNGEITGPISFDLNTKNESINNVEQPENLSNNTIGINDLNSVNNVLTNNEVSIEEPKVDNNTPDEITGPINFDLNSINTKPEEKTSEISSNLVEPIPVIEPKDPDAEIMKNTENTYSNSKSLLEILSDVDKSKPAPNVKIDNKEEAENIFNNKPNIEVNTSVQKEKVEIEPKYSSDDELDKIMKKLSSMNNEEEDSYTNIF